MAKVRLGHYEESLQPSSTGRSTSNANGCCRERPAHCGQQVQFLTYEGLNVLLHWARKASATPDQKMTYLHSCADHVCSECLLEVLQRLIQQERLLQGDCQRHQV